jgi:hypothetical protein
MKDDSPSQSSIFRIMPIQNVFNFMCDYTVCSDRALIKDIGTDVHSPQ